MPQFVILRAGRDSGWSRKIHQGGGFPEMDPATTPDGSAQDDGAWAAQDEGSD